MTESTAVSDVLIPQMTREGPQPISQQRRAEYVKIFKTIGCDGAVYYYPGSKANATFSMWSVGMLFAGQDKSIMLFPREPPTPIVETTDGYRWTQMDHQRGAVELYRHIDGPWYLGLRCELTLASRARFRFLKAARPPRSCRGA